jgi:hypothetical protein
LCAFHLDYNDYRKTSRRYNSPCLLHYIAHMYVSYKNESYYQSEQTAEEASGDQEVVHGLT